MSDSSTSKHELDFLVESDNIGGVYDRSSHKRAVSAWEYMKEQWFITNTVIRKVHKILYPLGGSGHYRRVDHCSRGHAVPPGASVYYLMDAYVEEYQHPPSPYETFRSEYGSARAEAYCKRAHVRFELIHPFESGNGRVGRILYNWQRVRMGLPVRVFKNRYRESYYAWFNT